MQVNPTTVLYVRGVKSIINSGLKLRKFYRFCCHQAKQVGHCRSFAPIWINSDPRITKIFRRKIRTDGRANCCNYYLNDSQLL